MKSTANILSVIGLVLIFTACADDDDNTSAGPADGGQSEGSSSFTVTGDVEAQHAGVAEFRAFESSSANSWHIKLLDYSPMTFDLTFAQFGVQPIDRPEPGTYALGTLGTDDVYATSYVHIEDESFFADDADEYTVGVGETSGELVITSSTDELIEGTFSFTAAFVDDDDNIAGSIEVTNGEFSAVPAQ